LNLRLVSKSTSVRSGFAVAVNQNALGPAMLERPFWLPALKLMSGATVDVVVPVELKKPAVENPTKTSLEVALTTSGRLVFALGPLPLERLEHAPRPEGKLDQQVWQRGQLVSSSSEAVAAFFVLTQSDNRFHFSLALVVVISCGDEAVVRAKVTGQQCAEIMQRNLRPCPVS
jgi:hypothetical protein